MQRKSHDRTTRVLTYGQTWEQFRFWKSMCKSGLQGAHMGWSLLADPRDTAEKAVAYIKECDDLEIVYLAAESKMPREQMLKDAEVIAKALAEHKHKPWVCYSGELDYLTSVFEKAGVTIAHYMLDAAIFERWRIQIEDKFEREVA